MHTIYIYIYIERERERFLFDQLLGTLCVWENGLTNNHSECTPEN